MGCIGVKSRSSIPVKINTSYIKYCINDIQKKSSASSQRENNSESLSRNDSNQSKIIRCLSYRKLTNIELDAMNKSIEGYIHRSFLNEKKLRNSKITNNLNKININDNQNTQTTKNETGENLILSNSQLNLNEIDFIKNALSNHFLFKDLSDEIISEIISNLVLINMNEGLYLFKEGDPGNFFYIVKEGELELRFNDDEIKNIRKGESFGELALIQKNLRSGTVKSLTDVEIYCLKGDLFKQIVLKMNNLDLKERISYLSLSPIFKFLDSNQIDDIARNMLKCEFEAGQLIDEKDAQDALYLIKEGVICTYYNTSENFNRIEYKEYFGLSALIFPNKKYILAVTEMYTKCYQITKNLLMDILGTDFLNRILQNVCRDAFSKIKMIKLLSLDEYFLKVYSMLNLRVYKKSEIILSHEDNDNQKLFILLEGFIAKSETGEIVGKSGDLYGTDSLKDNFSLDNEIIAISDCYCLESTWNEIISVLDFKIQENKILSFLFRISKLRKISIFKHLSELKLMEFSHLMKKEHFQQGELVFEEGSPGDKIYLLFKGKVKIVKNNKMIRELDRGSYFGEISILFNHPHSASVYALTNTLIYTIPTDKFMKNIDQNILEMLKKNIPLFDIFNIGIDDLYFIHNLGEGKFGTVSLVHDSRNIYAIKAVNRKSAENQKILIKYFLKERQILLCLDHPFIVKLVKTIKNEEFIFYLMEHINGIVLSKYLEKRPESRINNKYETMFITASLLSVVNYLNLKRIAHRDIKPDNIMIDDKGYLKLIDFGTAIEIKDFTKTITGTPHYIAPEVLLGRGYGYSADYWSIGVTAFEVFFNYYPFGNRAKDPMDVYKEVVKNEPLFPPEFEEKDPIIILIKKLLKKKVSERLCNLEVIKKEVFFDNFNFNELQEYRIKPPFIPETPKLDYFSFKKVKYIERINKVMFF